MAPEGVLSRYRNVPRQNIRGRRSASREGVRRSLLAIASRLCVQLQPQHGRKLRSGRQSDIAPLIRKPCHYLGAEAGLLGDGVAGEIATLDGTS